MGVIRGKIAAREALEALELSRKYTEPNQEILRPIASSRWTLL